MFLANSINSSDDPLDGSARLIMDAARKCISPKILHFLGSEPFTISETFYNSIILSHQEKETCEQNK